MGCGGVGRGFPTPGRAMLPPALPIMQAPLIDPTVIMQQQQQQQQMQLQVSSTVATAFPFCPPWTFNILLILERRLQGLLPGLVWAICCSFSVLLIHRAHMCSVCCICARVRGEEGTHAGNRCGITTHAGSPTHRLKVYVLGLQASLEGSLMPFIGRMFCCQFCLMVAHVLAVWLSVHLNCSSLMWLPDPNEHLLWRCLLWDSQAGENLQLSRGQPCYCRWRACVRVCVRVVFFPPRFPLKHRRGQGVLRVSCGFLS